MLRASCESVGISLDLRIVVDPTCDSGVAHYQELIAFAEALLARHLDDLAVAREKLTRLVGPEGVARAAAVIGNFQMMNFALDTIGATFGDKLPSRVKAMTELFGISPPPHWPQ